ncbi:hypothetical protein AZ66_01035 [Paenibacillus sp. E194]|uniref:hypothetical protein n=1 Tax=Paenibacillus sp. E194 TaxID=1458845 RepID=UPI0005CB1B05|nr:hypothetical protein [Paenibacillus sp. E194]KJB89646.1 hypothetical protein AZ66_01035 [Paenibacillus sp. E194]
MPYEAKTNWKYDDTVTEKDLNRIEQGLKDAHVAEYKDITLKPGVQVIEVDNDTPFNLRSIEGRTMVNLLGKNGRFVDLTKYLPDAVTAEKEGDYVKVTLNGSKERGTFRTSTTARVGEGAPKYLLVGVVNAGTAKSAHIELSDEVNYAISSNPITGTKDQVAFAIFDGSKTSRGMGVYLHIEGSKNSFAFFKDLRVYAITDSDANILPLLSLGEIINYYPYVDSITNVVNPYITCTSGNMLPPASEFKINADGIFIDGEYSFYFVAEGDENKGIYYDLAVSPNEKYGIYSECNNPKGNIRIEYYKDLSTAGNKNNFLFPRTYHATNEYDFFIPPPECGCVRVYISNEQEGTTTLPGNFKFTKFLMFPFTVTQPFAYQKRSMWAAECQLAAHPLDGSNPDQMLVRSDGLPYVIEKWKKIILDGTHKPSSIVTSRDGYKEIILTEVFEKGDRPKWAYMTKNDSLPLSYVKGAISAPNQFDTNGTSSLWVTISNADSGWGQDYNPSQEEIQAFFLGWRMYRGGQGNVDIPYNNEIEGRAWHPIDARFIHSSGIPSATHYKTVTPTLSIKKLSYARYGIFKPYFLQYFKAKQTVEVIDNYETGISFKSGWNYIESGSGIVLREQANIITSGEWAVANWKIKPESWFNYESRDLLGLYLGNSSTFKWDRSNYEPHGKLRISMRATDFDPSAVYYVTYTMLEPSLMMPLRGVIATNIRGTVTELEKCVKNAERRLSVVEAKKAQMVDDTGWIKVTTLNNWVHYSANPLYFRVAGNRLFLKGTLADGITSENTKLFQLPVILPTGFISYFQAGTWMSGTASLINCIFRTDGSLSINAGTASKYVGFDGLELLIDGMVVNKS